MNELMNERTNCYSHKQYSNKEHMCIITNVPIMCEELLNQRSVSLLNLWFSASVSWSILSVFLFALMIAMFVNLRFTSEICFETLVGRLGPARRLQVARSAFRGLLDSMFLRKNRR
jgi:hypothetical protein